MERHWLIIKPLRQEMDAAYSASTGKPYGKYADYGNADYRNADVRGSDWFHRLSLFNHFGF